MRWRHLDSSKKPVRLFECQTFLFSVSRSSLWRGRSIVQWNDPDRNFLFLPHRLSRLRRRTMLGPAGRSIEVRGLLNSSRFLGLLIKLWTSNLEFWTTTNSLFALFTLYVDIEGRSLKKRTIVETEPGGRADAVLVGSTARPHSEWLWLRPLLLCMTGSGQH